MYIQFIIMCDVHFIFYWWSHIFVQDNYNNDYYYLEYILSFTYLSLRVYSAVYFMFFVENNVCIYIYIADVIIFY